MAQVVKLLNHQAQFLQAPYLLNDIRFFILCGGFACGKTSSLVYVVNFAVKNLLGKKDKEGHNPRIMVGSKNITFLAKTWTDAFEQNLKMTGSNYHFDRAKNIITIGNVEIILVATEEPTNIYGYSCFEENTLIATSKGNIPIKDIKAGDLVFTTKGFKTVKNVKYMGEKPCMSVFVNGQEITCTTDHRFIDVFDNDIKAKDLTYMSSLVTLDEKEWKKWLFVSGLIEQSQKLLTLMALDITDTLKVKHMEKGVILPAQMKIRKKVSQLCTEICGLLSMAKYLKDMTYITKMGTALTTLLQTLNVLKEASILKSIGNCNKKKDYSRLLKHLKKHRKEIKSCIKKKNTEPSYLKRLRNQVNRNLSSVLVSSAKKSSLDTAENVMYVLQSAEGKKKEDNSRKGILQTLKSVFALFAERRLMYSNTQLLKLAHPLVKTTKEGEPYIKGVYRVYDIEVEDCHEYFANGVRVHNCVMSVIDELDELPTNIAMEAVKSVNDRVRQQIEGFRDPFICFATTSQGLKGLYQTVMHFKKSGIGYFLLRARTRDNTYLPVEYVKNMYSIYNEKEVRCLLEGEFISIDSGLVFPDYNPAVNKLDEDLFDCLEDNDVVYIGQDFNSFGNHAVAFVVKKFDDGTSAIVAIKDYKLPDMRRAPEVFRYDFPTQKIVWIPDMTYKEHFIEFKKELRAFNITIAYRSCNPLVNDRVFACNKLFHAERLFICPICKDLETALLTHQRDPKTGMPMKGGETAPDHKSDCLGYAVHYLLSWNRDLKELYDVTLRYMYSKRKARGADSTELEPEDSLISADKIKAIPLKKANNVDKNNFNK